MRQCSPRSCSPVSVAPGRIASSSPASTWVRCPGVSIPRALNLVVITLDTTRADRLGPYGSPERRHAESRRARAGRRAVRSRQHRRADHAARPIRRSSPGASRRSTACATTAATFSATRRQTLAETLKARGYATGGFIAAYVLDSQVGHRAGVRHLLRRLRSLEVQGLLDGRDPAAGQRGRRQGAALDRSAPRRSRSSPGCISTTRTRPTVRPSRSGAAIRTIPTRGRSRLPTRRSGRVVQFLRDRELFDRTVIVVLGDHGESLNDHGEEGHGFFVYESVVHVPMIIRAPFSAMQEPPRDRLRPVDRRDADGARPARRADAGRRRMDGVSVTAADDRGPPRHGPRGLRRGGLPAAPFRLERSARAAPGALQADRRAAPGALRSAGGSGEATNSFRRARRSATGCSAVSLRWRRISRRRRRRRAEAVEIDPDAKARLAALGYVGSFVASVGDDASRAGLADPKDKVRPLQPDHHAPATWARTRTRSPRR